MSHKTKLALSTVIAIILPYDFVFLKDFFQNNITTLPTFLFQHIVAAFMGLFTRRNRNPQDMFFESTAAQTVEVNYAMILAKLIGRYVIYVLIVFLIMSVIEEYKKATPKKT